MSTSAQDRRIRLPAVVERVGLKRSAIYKRIKERTFPSPRKDGGASVWLEREIAAYIAGTWTPADATPGRQASQTTAASA